LRKAITLLRDIRGIERLGAGLDGIAIFGSRRIVLAQKELVGDCIITRVWNRWRTEFHDVH
jgi:hypothetical protein